MKMKMFRFLKSTLRTVHEEEEQHEQEHKTTESTNQGGASTSLTVWRKSLLISCNGFTVIGSNGDLVYRVDNYSGRPEEITLMDAPGKPVLTILRRRKTLRLVDSWRVYEGEAGDGEDCRRASKSSEEKPVWSIRKHIKNILNPINPKPKPNAIAYVYRGGEDKSAYVVEGSYAERSCKVWNESRRVVVAEIKRKEASKGGVSFGLEVFLLVVHPGFDPGFAMALVLVLDQMFA